MPKLALLRKSRLQAQSKEMSVRSFIVFTPCALQSWSLGPRSNGWLALYRDTRLASVQGGGRPSGDASARMVGQAAVPDHDREKGSKVLFLMKIYL
jgi:hypothetical protein